MPGVTYREATDLRRDSYQKMVSAPLSHTCQPSASAEELKSPGAQEPKWKQKLAAADAQAEKTRQLTAQAQEEYRIRQATLRQNADKEGGAARPLSALPLLPYLTETGTFTDCSQPDSKACVYAIFDQSQVLRYIGVSRQVNPSLRLHFARMPRECWGVKIQHIAKPSRALLEGIRERWMEENGGRPDGNDEGAVQMVWENPVDCKPLMTEEEREKVETAAPGPPTYKAYKEVARRVEKELEAGFKERKCTETLRFDPKLKEQGLLDLKNVAPPRDTAVPTESVPTQGKEVSSVA